MPGERRSLAIDFKKHAGEIAPACLRFDTLETLQVNVGNLCNQQCRHCHVDAGPRGDRVMGRGVVDRIVAFLRRRMGITLDITGGCPELNPNFRALVEQSRPLVSRLMVRTNLTILLEDGMNWVVPWYRDNQIALVASMPCYTQENVDAQRGQGVFQKSIEALRRLNKLGYGQTLELDLMYNPSSPELPSAQSALENDYRRELGRYGIGFSRLLTMTNAPLGRFAGSLAASGEKQAYLELLLSTFNSAALANLMCRTLISVDWQGHLYDCDFNQAAGLPISDAHGRVSTIDSLEEAAARGREVAFGEHCYSCTAGAGSSCTGSLIPG